MEEPSTPRPAPARWSDAEEAQLLQQVQQGVVVRDLALAHGRSIGAIESRLQQLGVYDYAPYNELVTESAVVAEAEHATSGKPWVEADVALLLATYHTHGQSPTPQEDLRLLATTLGRSPRALVLKLVQLGALTPTLAANPQRRIAPTKPLKAPTPVKPPAARQKITVTPEFQTALAALQQSENLLVLGKAGTGKSTFLRWIKAQLGNKAPVLLAPTGMAALQVGGQTIHSFFGLKPQLMQGNSHDWHKPRNPKIFTQLQLLIIDEISMVRADVFDAMDRFLRLYGPHKKQPFGGVQVLLVGDLCQLPPVVRNEEMAEFSERYATPFFFSSQSYASSNFGCISFTQVFRQADATFIELLNAVRVGRLSPTQLDILNKRVSIHPPAESILLAARNRTVEAINSTEIEKLPGMPRTYLGQTKGKMDGNALTTPTELLLKPGARVLFTRNDAQGRWVNGSLGHVQKCGDGFAEVRLLNGPQTGDVHRVEPVTWESTSFTLDDNALPIATVAGSFTQLPLTLAWALTIHKAQGQTLPQCVVDLADGGTFAEGQLYVALSRATSLEGLYLKQPIQPKHLKTNPAVMDFLSQIEGPQTVAQ